MKARLAPARHLCSCHLFWRQACVGTGHAWVWVARRHGHEWPAVKQPDLAITRVRPFIPLQPSFQDLDFGFWFRVLSAEAV